MLASFTSILPSGIGFSNRDDREREKQDKERERERERERASEAAEEVTPRANDNDGKMKDSAVDEHGMKKRRERNPTETFIVVRPPPSVSNHPLNLQIQLVPPQAKDRSASGASSGSGLSRPSVDTSGEEVGDGLSRAQSIRSTGSDLASSSFYASSSTTSMSSIASSASTSTAGRRMIVPLYNLSAHNVMTNTILDAGTDAKVAKLTKRGMEIIGLAILECVEVWPGFGRVGPGHVTFLNPSVSANGASPSGPAGAGGPGLSPPYAYELDPDFQNEMEDTDALLVTPTSSAISLSSTGSHPSHPHSYPHPQSHPYMQGSAGGRGTPKTARPTSSAGISPTPPPSASATGAKRIFGKIFKKRDSQTQSPEATITVVPPAAGSGSHQRTGSTMIDERDGLTPSRSDTGTGTGLSLGARKRRSLNTSSPTPSHFTLPPVPGASPAIVATSSGGGSKELPQLQPAVLGIQPTLSSPVVPPAGRPTRYVWTVRKWLKGGDGGLLGGVMRGVGMVGAGIGMSGIGQGGAGQGQMFGQGQGVEVRFEWVRGQSKSLEKRRARRSAAQAALGKRGSMSIGQEEAVVQRSRMSLAAERSAERKQLEKSRSRGRGGGRPTTASGGTPRVSMDSEEPRRSAEQTTTSHGSRSNSMTSALSDDLLRNRGAVEEEGEDSDPEDSETPWTCTVVVSSMVSSANRLWEHEYLERDGPGLSKRDSKKSQLSHTQEGSSIGEPSKAMSHAPGIASPDTPPPVPPKPPKVRPEAPGTLLRLKVGALSPAPHHPKVVAQLKVPYPLPDVEVTRGRIRRRVLTPAGVARPVSRGEALGDDAERTDRPRSKSNVFSNFGSGYGNGNGAGGESEGLVLTAEEIKDVLSCTAFWIVVREGFGGVGKVNRKGDGWRIRG